MKKTFCLENLDCANCAAKMEHAVSRIDGVNRVSVSFLTQRMTLDAEAGVVRWVESAEDDRSLVCAVALAPAGEFPRLDWLEHRLVTELNASPEE